MDSEKGTEGHRGRFNCSRCWLWFASRRLSFLACHFAVGCDLVFGSRDFRSNYFWRLAFWRRRRSVTLVAAASTQLADAAQAVARARTQTRRRWWCWWRCTARCCVGAGGCDVVTSRRRRGLHPRRRRVAGRRRGSLVGPRRRPDWSRGRKRPRTQRSPLGGGGGCGWAAGDVAFALAITILAGKTK